MIKLREVTNTDKEKILNWRNLKSVSRYMYYDHEISIKEHELWFTRIMSDPTVKYWIIVLNNYDIGLANLYNINNYHKRCYWAFYIANEDTRGKGVGSFVEYFILSYVFDTIKMEKLCCEVLATNKNVIALHKKFGFKQEGLFIKHIIKAGKREDVYSLAILNEEWKLIKSNLSEKYKDII